MLMLFPSSFKLFFFFLFNYSTWVKKINTDYKRSTTTFQFNSEGMINNVSGPGQYLSVNTDGLTDFPLIA